jgi:hypothetical protein
MRANRVLMPVGPPSISGASRVFGPYVPWGPAVGIDIALGLPHGEPPLLGSPKPEAALGGLSS